MPEHHVHDFASKVVLGRTFKSVDDSLDWWVRCMGRNHRKVFHDCLTAPIVGVVVSGSLLGAAAAGIHILLDHACTKNKSFEKLLKTLAKNASQRKH